MPTSTSPLTPEQIAELVELYPLTTQGEYSTEYHNARGDYVRVVLVARSSEFECGYYVVAADDMEARRNQTIKDFKFYEAAHNAMPSLLGMLAEKDAALLAEQKDHQLTIDTFRQQERIWDQKFDALRAELQQKEAEIEFNRQYVKACEAGNVEMAADLQQANARIAELEAAQPTREEFDDERISAPLTERELEQPK